MIAIRPWSLDNLPCPIFETVGRVIFDPERGQMKRRISNWVVVEIDRGLTAYYRWHLRRNWWRVDLGGRRRPVYQPSWDAHLSVVRGERAYALGLERTTALWWDAHTRFHGREVKVSYCNTIRQSGDTNAAQPDHFWFVDAYSECVLGIRNLLCLPYGDSKTGRPFSSHITIARTEQT